AVEGGAGGGRVLNADPSPADIGDGGLHLDDGLTGEPEQTVDVMDTEPEQDAVAAALPVEQVVGGIPDADRRRDEHRLRAEQPAQPSGLDPVAGLLPGGVEVAGAPPRRPAPPPRPPPHRPS